MRQGFGGVADGGKSFSRGRGFVAKQRKPEDDWQNANKQVGGKCEIFLL